MPFLACRHTRGSAGSESGQAIMEFLPVAMLLLMLAFAVVDFGFFIWQKQVITGLTREGANLASRGPTLSGAAAVVISDGSVLNLSKNGRVILTTIRNTGTSAKPVFTITGQYATGSLSATSKIGAYNPNKPVTVTLTPPAADPAMAVPQPGATLFVTEVYCSFTHLTPLGAFMKYTMPTQMYDAAYF